MEKITWKTEKRKTADLVPAEYNPRDLTTKEREDLKKSITDFGEAEPVVINLDNKIIGGHQRLKIYADLKIIEIDVRVPSRQLSIEEEINLNLRLNKNTGHWEWEKMTEFSEEVLLEIGFTPRELHLMKGKNDGLELPELDAGGAKMKTLTVYYDEPTMEEVSDELSKWEGSNVSEKFLALIRGQNHGE